MEHAPASRPSPPRHRRVAARPARTRSAAANQRRPLRTFCVRRLAYERYAGSPEGLSSAELPLWLCPGQPAAVNLGTFPLPHSEESCSLLNASSRLPGLGASPQDLKTWKPHYKRLCCPELCVLGVNPASSKTECQHSLQRVSDIGKKEHVLQPALTSESKYANVTCPSCPSRQLRRTVGG